MGLLSAADAKRYMDAETLKKIAELVRKRAAMAVVSSEDRERLQDRRDGLERLGAQRVLEQLAIDLDVMADHSGQQGDRE